MTGRRPLLAVLALAATLVVVVAVLALPRGEPAVAPSPSPTATQTSSPSATASPTQPAASPSPSPTASPSPSPQSARFVNAVLGYSIDLPPPWRHSSCFSSSVNAALQGTDIFVPVTEYDEMQGHTGLAHDHLQVHAQSNPDRMTPRQWWDAERSPHSGGTLTDVTLAGRPALKIEDDTSRPGGSERYLVANDTHMFEVSGQPRDSSGVSTKAQRAAILLTFRFLRADELSAARAAPTPTPPPARSPDEVARVLADGFARRDVALLATLVGKSCLVIGVAQGGASRINAQRYLDELRPRFARGLTVSVRANELENAPGLDDPTRLVESTWKEPGQPDLEVDLMISPKTNDHWYWSGVVLRFIGR